MRNAALVPLASLLVLAPPAAAAALPDLVVEVAGVPGAAMAGQDIGGQIRVFVKNVGHAPAPGTTNHPSGYMVDLTLGRDAAVAAGFRVFAPNFAEDVLLAGGRVSRTVDLAPGAFHEYAAGAKVPNDTPTGDYFVCAKVDPGAAVAESNEVNNTTCRRIHVQGRVKVGPQEDLPVK